MPKISVVIPVYNVERYLHECLDSVLSQMFNDIEVICVNDGSTDGSFEILQEYAQRDGRVAVLTQENKGLSAARNAGLSASLGEYVYFLDSDDFISPDVLGEMYGISHENKLDILCFDGISFFETKELREKHSFFIGYAQRKGEYPGIVSGPSLFSAMLKNRDFQPSVCLQLFRRDFLSGAGIDFYEGILHEDNLFTFLATLQAKRVMHVRKAYFHRRVRENSTMTEEKSHRHFKGVFICFAQMLHYAINREFGKEVDTAIWKYIRSILFSAKRIYRNLPEHEQKGFEWDGGQWAEIFFREMIHDPETAYEKQLERELQNIRRSRSFRIGRFITFVPRKIRGGIFCCRNYGFAYACRRLFIKLGLISRTSGL